MLDNTPQLPDPISMMPAPPLSGPGLGKTLMEGAQNMGDFLVEALGAALDKTVKGAVALGGKAVDVVASGVERVSSVAAAPFKPDFTPSSSPAQAAAPDGPSQGRARGMEVSSPEVSYASLGTLTPDPIGAPQISQGQGMYRS